MIYIASDHGGFKLKKRLIRYLQNDLKIDVEDMGPDQYDKTDDYPDFAEPLAKKVLENKDSLGIMICGAGQGSCIATNKVNGIRAAIGYSVEGAKMSKIDNDANILCLAGRMISEDHAMTIVKHWIETPFSKEDRHVRRLGKLEKIEERN